MRTITYHHQQKMLWGKINKNLRNAVTTGNFDRICCLLRSGEKHFNENFARGRYLLHSSVDLNQLKSIDALMMWNRADIDERGHQNRTALHKAAEIGRCEVIICLLNYKADIEAQDEDGLTPPTSCGTKRPC